MMSRTFSAHFFRAGAAVALLALLTAPAQAIIVCGDPSTHEVQPGSRFDGVGLLQASGRSTGVLLDEWHVLTSAHGSRDLNGATFTIHTAWGTQEIPVVSREVHSSCDVAILRLASPAGHGGYGLYAATDQQTQIGYYAGFGVSGTGSPDNQTYPVGTLRVARNRIDNAFGTYLSADLDEPTKVGTYGCLGVGVEGLPGVGDSGGPTFFDVDGELLIAGIHKSVSDVDGDGVFPEYGDRAYDTRVSSVADWVNATLAQAPEPGTLALMGLGTLLVVGHRKTC
jgi:hypothetical protein